MLNFKLFLVTLLFMVMTLVDAQAQVRRGPRYNPHRRYPDHRPVPAPYPDHRPSPRPIPDYRPSPDDYYSRGRVSCSATDNGWEEHWGGHSSCGSCLQDHSSCIERCHEVRQACEVQGTDYAGRTITFTARGGDRWTAESEARRQCEWSRDMRSCVLTTCREESQLISSRSCR